MALLTPSKTKSTLIDVTAKKLTGYSATKSGLYLLDDGCLVQPDELAFYDDLNSQLGGYDFTEREIRKAQGLSLDRPLEFTPSEWTELAVKIPTEGVPIPFSFEKRRYLPPIYNINNRRVLLCCGRQVEKSTLLGNSILATMCTIPHFRGLYVSSSHEQTKTFRRDRITSPIAMSPMLQAFTSKRHVDNISLLTFVNHASLTLRYSYLNADRTRGIPADRVYIDEIQDILTDNIPVIEECASHGRQDIRMFLYSGTPKTMDNSIEYLWGTFSTKNEWMVPSRVTTSVGGGSPSVSASRKYWNILDKDTIGKNGLICKKTGQSIYANDPDSQWVTTRPSVRKNEELEHYESYRIPQLMVPWNSDDTSWGSILNKRETYSDAKFHNEVLGFSYDSGDRPLTTECLIQNSDQQCDVMGRSPAEAKDWLKRHGADNIFVGVDWGTGEKSYTVMTVGGYCRLNGSERFTIAWMKRFTGQYLDPQRLLEAILELIHIFKPTYAGFDYGGGFDKNDRVVKEFGPVRILRYQSLGFNSASSNRPIITYDHRKGRFMLDRTAVMSRIFNAIRDGKFRFPRWESWEDPHARDMLCIFSEYSEASRSIKYDKPRDQTDDTFHSMMYCFLSSLKVNPRTDIMEPERTGYRHLLHEEDRMQEGSEYYDADEWM